MPGEIKSTLEIALEKAARLPRLTEEELREQLEKELRPRARGLVARFLAGELTEKEMLAEVFRLQGSEGRIFRRAFFDAVCDSVAAAGPEQIPRIHVTLHAVVEAQHRREIADCLNALLSDHDRQKQQARAATEEAEVARVRALGISGPAVRINLRDNKHWQQRERELREELTRNLEQFKERWGSHLSTPAGERLS